MKIHFLVFLTFINIISGLPEPFDFVEESIEKYVSKSTIDACEDFYRHACPLGAPESLINHAFERIISELKENEAFPADSFEFYHALNEFGESFFKRLSRSENRTHFLIPAFRTVCNMEKDWSYYFMTDILLELGVVPQFEWNRHLTCDDLAHEYALDFGSIQSGMVVQMFDRLQKYTIKFTWLMQQANEASAVSIFNITEGIRESEEIGEQLLKLAKQWLSQTPWARYHNVTEVIEKYTSTLHLYKDLYNDSVELEGLLISIERMYNECRMRFFDSEDTRLFCFVVTALKKNLNDIVDYGNFFLGNNAFNNHPMIVFAFPYYYYAQHGNEYASIIATVGAAFGHEIGHSFIEDHYDPKGIGFFSKKAQDCIQNQFDKTCKEFKEEDCLTADIMLDENGADIFGNKLAYAMLEEHYGENLTSIIPRLGITNEQLFFYAYVYPSCSGLKSDINYGTIDNDDGTSKRVLDTHASDNVRINVLAQLPGFKRAFNCPDDSRMMRSATEECIVYGKEAPDTRKKH